MVALLIVIIQNIVKMMKSGFAIVLVGLFCVVTSLEEEVEMEGETTEGMSIVVGVTSCT